MRAQTAVMQSAWVVFGAIAQFYGGRLPIHPFDSVSAAITDWPQVAPATPSPRPAQFAVTTTFEAKP